MKKITFLFLLTASTCFAGNEDQSYGARSGALGNASVTLADEWCTFNNQGGLGFVRKTAVGTFYEDRFLLSQLSAKAFTFVLPVKGGTFGLSYSGFGYSAYSESKYGLAFGKAFGEQLSAGIQLDYLNTRISENYGSKGGVAAEAGLLFRATKKLAIAAHLFNLTRTRLADYGNERIPTVMRLGIQYTPSEKLFLIAEAEKNMNHKALLKVGAEYQVMKVLYLRGGVASDPALSCFGFGLRLKGFKLDVTSTYHPVLGFSPQLGLGYEFSK